MHYSCTVSGGSQVILALALRYVCTLKRLSIMFGLARFGGRVHAILDKYLD